MSSSDEDFDSIYVVEFDNFLKLYEEIKTYHDTMPHLLAFYSKKYKDHRKSPADMLSDYYKVVKVIMSVLDDKSDITEEEQVFLVENDIEGILFTKEQYEDLQKLLDNLEKLQEKLAKHNISVMVN
jgi:hypothetical protein